jgi:hypothetical protein
MFDVFPDRGSDGWNESWFQNRCILYWRPVPYDIRPCDTTKLYVPYLADNKIYIPSSASIGFDCMVNGSSKNLSLAQWQAYGVDAGTTIETAPDIQTIIQWGREMLQAST